MAFHATPGKIVLFGSGQSNMCDFFPHAWTPAPNLLAWNLKPWVEPSSAVGTGFVVPDGTMIGSGLATAHFVAVNNPDCMVYFINISVGGCELANWGSSPPDYNFRQSIEANVAAALAKAGVSEIDGYIWAGCEEDTKLENQNLMADFEAMCTWLGTHSWFNEAVPIYILGMSPHAYIDAGDFRFRRYNGFLRAIAGARPNRRAYCDFGDFPQALFDPSNGLPYIHKTGPGHYTTGARVARAIEHGLNEPVVRSINVSAPYVPTITDQSNLSAVSVVKAQWLRAGNMVMVAVQSLATPTAAGVASFSVAAPVFAKAGIAPVGVVSPGKLVAVSDRKIGVTFTAPSSGQLSIDLLAMYQVTEGDQLPNPL